MKVTIADIAKMANVSKATVSRVINKKPEGVGRETRNRILKIVEESNFQPSMIARGLVTKKTKTLGLIIPDITNPFFPQLVRGAEDYSNKCGYSLFLCNSDKSIKKEQLYIKAFIEKSVDGVILTSNISKQNTHHELLKHNDIPIVLLDRYVEGTEYDAGVFLDNIKGAFTATDYFLRNGHKDIAFISGPRLVHTSINRLKGYKLAHEKNGIEIRDYLIREGDYRLDCGFEATEKLLDEGRKFTAVFAANDMMAIGAVKALKSRNVRIPEEVEVIGFDGIEISQILEPSLSTVAQPVYEMGTLGAKLLIRLIEGKRLQKKIITLEPQLILRETTRGKQDG